jgi:MFS family permease
MWVVRRGSEPTGGFPNALVMLWSEPSWSLLAAWQASYQTVFMVAAGLTPVAVGLAVGASGLLQAVGLLVVDTLAARFGRKWVIMVGDLLGWVMVLGLWVLEPHPWAFAVGLIVMNATGAIMPAWNSLFCEDLSSHRVTYYYMVLQLLGLAGGLILPVLVPVVHRLGVVGSGELVLAIGWPLVTLSWIVRQFGLRESRDGLAARHAHRSGVRTRIGIRVREGTRGPLGVLAALRVLVRVPVALFSAFAPLVLVAARGDGLSPVLLAYLPVAGSVAGGVVLLTHVRWRRAAPKRLLLLALGLMVSGMLLVSEAPAHGFWAVMAAWALASAGQAWFWSVHTPLWVGSLSPYVRVTVQGWTGAISALLVTVLAPTMASMVGHSPRLVAMLWVVPLAAGLLILGATPVLPTAAADA